MSFRIRYHGLVVKKDIPGLPFEWREEIKRAIEKKLTVCPEIYGKPLRQSLRGYRRLRVADYRVIFKIEKDKTVSILMICHRSAIYKNIRRREY